MPSAPLTPATPWFERKFDYALPVELLPPLLMRLRGTPARLEETLRGRQLDLLTRRPGDKWSAQEHAGHLLELEALWTARLEDYLQGNEQLTPADLTNRRTHDADYNSKPLDEILAGFRQKRASMLQQVSHSDAANFSRALPHPRLKTPMRLMDHLHFVAEHDDHHLAFIWHLLSDAK